MQIRCVECGCLVDEILPGSKIKKGTVYTCKDCNAPEIFEGASSGDVGVEQLKKIFGMR